MSEERHLEFIKEVYGLESQIYADVLIVPHLVFERYDGPVIDLEDARGFYVKFRLL